MKLAEALSLRADYQKRIAQLKARLERNAKVQEGDRPAEDPEGLLAELDDCLTAYERLVAQINLTNSKAFAGGRTLTELIAKKDALLLRSEVLRSFLEAASQKTDRYSSKEIRLLSTVDVPKLQKQADALSKELRELDVSLQEANWTVELCP